MHLPWQHLINFLLLHILCKFHVKFDLKNTTIFDTILPWQVSRSYLIPTFCGFSTGYSSYKTWQFLIRICHGKFSCSNLILNFLNGTTAILHFFATWHFSFEQDSGKFMDFAVASFGTNLPWHFSCSYI